MHGRYILRNFRQIAGGNHSPGGCLVVELVLGIAVDELDEGQRRRARGGDAQVVINPGLFKALAQRIAEHVARQAGEETGIGAKPAERDGGVEYRATGYREVDVAAVRQLPWQHVDQCFAATKDHVYSNSKVTGRAEGWCGRSLCCAAGIPGFTVPNTPI